jgi:hypothetical protein
VGHGGGADGGGVGLTLFLKTDLRKKELLFVNKKKQKNFICFGSGRFHPCAKRSKSFLQSFFTKKRPLA